MNYILPCAIVVLFGLLGFNLSKEVVLKYNFYKSLTEFLSYLKVNIGFEHMLLENNFKNHVSSKEFNEFIGNVMLQIKSDTLTEINLKRALYIRVKDDELNEIYMFFKQLGKRDVYSQKDMIAMYLEIFGNRLSVAENEKNKNAKIYSKLGIGVGLIVAIIFI